MSHYTLENIEQDYYLGSYQTCINKAASMPISRESIYYMCLVNYHLKKWDELDRELEKANKCEVKDDISDNETFVDLIHLLKEDSPDCVKALNVMDAKKVLKEGDELSRLLAANIYARNKEYVKALQVIHRFDSLRASHERIKIYIMMNRADLAQKELAKMEKKDDQRPITELASALVAMASSNYNQAWRIALTLAERYQPTPLLNNIQAAAAMCQQNFETAKELCEASLNMDADDVVAQINMIHILYKTRASDSEIRRRIERLESHHPKHEFVQEYKSMMREMESW